MRRPASRAKAFRSSPKRCRRVPRGEAPEGIRPALFKQAMISVSDLDAEQRVVHPTLRFVTSSSVGMTL